MVNTTIAIDVDLGEMKQYMSLPAMVLYITSILGLVIFFLLFVYYLYMEVLLCKEDCTLVSDDNLSTCSDLSPNKSNRRLKTTSSPRKLKEMNSQFNPLIKILTQSQVKEVL